MVWGALLLAQSLGGGLPEIIAKLTDALRNPWVVRWTDKSLLTILADQFIPAPEVAGTYWTFIGGYVDGVQMTADQTQEVMSQLHDVYQFIFVDDSTVVLAEDEDQTEGTYTMGEDGMTAVIEVGGVKYAGTFIEQEDGYVLVAMLDGTGMNGLYFHLMDDAPEK